MTYNGIDRLYTQWQARPGHKQKLNKTIGDILHRVWALV